MWTKIFYEKLVFAGCCLLLSSWRLISKCISNMISPNHRLQKWKIPRFSWHRLPTSYPYHVCTNQVNHLKILIVWLVLQLTGYCWKATSITAIHVPEPWYVVPVGFNSSLHQLAWDWKALMLLMYLFSNDLKS